MHLLIKNAVNYVDFDVTNMKAIPDATSIHAPALYSLNFVSKTVYLGVYFTRIRGTF